METTRRNRHAFRSLAIMGGFLSVFLCFPASAHAGDWGFSIHIPFLEFYVGPYDPFYDECCCPLYGPSQWYSPWRRHPAPNPIPGIENDPYRKEADPSNPASGRQSSVEDRHPRYGAPERIASRTRPDATASRSVGPDPSVENQRNEPVGAGADRGVERNPTVDPEGSLDKGTDAELKGSEGSPQDAPSDATQSQEKQSEGSESLIPLEGVN